MTNKNKAVNLSVFGHLDELRQRLFYALGFLVLGMAGGMYFVEEIVHFIELPALGAVSSFVVVKPTEIISIYFKISLYLGAVISAPALAYNAWQYIKPAVPKDANVSFFWWLAAAAMLFFVGTAFSYKILLPAAYLFLMGLSKELASPMITLGSYISFALSIIVLGGGIFEMPLVSALLTRLQIITPMFLRKKRKEAMFILCITAAVITPTTDIFNMLLFVAPMLLLFEISVLVSSLIYKLYIKDPAGGIYEK